MGVLGYNPPMRFFNAAGPCNPDKHYMIPATSRFGEDVDLWRIIAQEACFVIHAPRQVGKTTAMLQLAQDLTASGQYIPDKLLAAFLAFWRQHGQPLLKAAPYHEIAPHLVLMAFLHRVVNGGGTLEREYAIGTGKMDLCLRYGAVTLAMELKVWRDGRRDPLEQGLEQLDNYLNGLRLEAGWLVIFDQRSGLPPISERTETAVAITPGNRTVTVIRG